MYHHPFLLKQFNFSKLVVHPSIITPTNFCGKEKSPGVARCKWWLRGALPLSLATLASLTCPALGELGGPAHPLECRPPHYSTLAATHPPVLNFFLPGFSQYMDQFLEGRKFGCFFCQLKKIRASVWPNLLRRRRFSTIGCLLFVVDAKNTLVGPVGPFKSTLILTVFSPDRRFLAMFEVGIDDCNCN